MVANLPRELDFLIECISLGLSRSMSNLGEDVRRLDSPPYVLCPSGRIAERVLSARRDDCVLLADADQRRWGTSVDGIPVSGYEDAVRDHRDATFLICSSMYSDAIEARLRSLGARSVISYAKLAFVHPDLFANREYEGMTESLFDSRAPDQIVELWHRLSDEQSRQVLVNKIRFYLTRDHQYLRKIKSLDTPYFANDVIHPVEHIEAFFDIGAYDGDTLTDWLAKGPRSFRKYLAIEPDTAAFRLLQTISHEITNVVCLDLGISDRSGTVEFSGNGVADSVIVESASDVELSKQTIITTTIDELSEIHGLPTQVKMDIEGGERRAIRGGSGVLSDSSVRLSISAYHHPWDLWEIPLGLIGLRPDADVYLRHYTGEVDDTVCYVV